MKHSIKKIFDNLFINSLFILLFAIFSILLLIDSNLSMQKTDILLNQKATISELTKFDTQDSEIALIKFNGISAQLMNDLEKLKNLHKYNFVEKLILNDSSKYKNELQQLHTYIQVFKDDVHTHLFYTKDTNNTQSSLENVKIAFDNLNLHLDAMLVRETLNTQEKFPMHQLTTVFSFLLILVFVIIYKMRSNQIYQDLLFLYSVENKNKKHTIIFEETDAIAMRMKRKSVLTDNPDMIDKVTNLYNNQGLVYNYKNKKSMKEDHPIALTVFEIDNFSRTQRNYSQDAIQSILKKVAYTLSLYQQPTDIIARTDFNQFTLIFVRANKKELFEEIEKIRQNISELKFNLPNLGAINVTVTGGFAIKGSKMHFEELIKISKEALKYAQKEGGNKTFQERDIKLRETGSIL